MNKPKYFYPLLTTFFTISVVCVSLSVSCIWLVDRCVTPPSITLFLLPGALVIALMVTISRYVWRTWRYTKQLTKASLYLPEPLQALIQELGIDRQIVVLVRSSQPLVFCFGLLRPQICISTGLIDLLSSAQLRAALLHEDYHRQHLDPLRILLVDAVAKVLFFLPIIADWASYVKTRRELAADAYAIEQVGKSPLAGALHRLLTLSTSPVRPTAGIATAGMSANATRIAALLGERCAVAPVSPRSLVQSIAVIWLICLFFRAVM